MDIEDQRLPAVRIVPRVCDGPNSVLVGCSWLEPGDQAQLRTGIQVADFDPRWSSARWPHNVAPHAAIEIHVSHRRPQHLNVVDVGRSTAGHIVRMLNYSPLDTLHTSTRLSTMEALLARYESARQQRGLSG